MPYNTNVIKNNKDKVIELEIDIGLRNDMVRTTRDRIIDNLEATKRFLDLIEERYDHICAGLFTYAVEEYGKILFLTSLSPSSPNNKIKVPYTHKNQGFLDHEHKFNLALNDKDLPSSCKVLFEGGFTDTGFTKTGFTHDTLPNFDARMSVFYTDFDKENGYNSILIPPLTKRDLLVKAVGDFLEFIL